MVVKAYVLPPSIVLLYFYSFYVKIRNHYKRGRRNPLKKKKSASRLFINIFFKTFGTIMLLIIVGMVSYQITMKCYEGVDNLTERTVSLDIVGDVTAD